MSEAPTAEQFERLERLYAASVERVATLRKMLDEATAQRDEIRSTLTRLSLQVAVQACVEAADSDDPEAAADELVALMRQASTH